MGAFLDSGIKKGNKQSQDSTSAMASGGTITGSPVFNNGDNGRITTAASANSAGGSGAAGVGIDFKVMALIAGVVLVLAVVALKKKKIKHGGKKHG